MPRCCAGSQAKREQGNVAFKARDFAKAVFFYTEAIELDGTDHRSFSNRASARLALGRYEDVVEDADACNMVAPREFVKHLNTKSRALLRLGKVSDARASAQAALDRDPANANAKELIRELGDPEADEDSPAPAPRGASAPALPAGTVEMAVMAARAAAIVCALVFLLSGLVFDARLGQMCFLGSLAIGTLLNLWHSVRGAMRTAGGFSFSMGFVQAALQQPSTPLVLLGTTFMSGRPLLLVLWPLLCYEVMFLSGDIERAVPAAKPGIRWVANQVMTRVGGNAAFAASEDASVRVANAHPFLAKTSAQLQLMLFGVLVVELLMPTRNLVGLLLHGQNLMMQYAVSPQMREAVIALEAFLRGYAHHPSCPAAVSSAYDAAVRGIASFADLREHARAAAEREEAGEAGAAGSGGLMSSCAVM